MKLSLQYSESVTKTTLFDDFTSSSGTRTILRTRDNFRLYDEGGMHEFDFLLDL